MIVFDGTFNQDWELNFSNDFPARLQLNFNIEGEIWHILNHGDILYQLNPLQGSITSCPIESTHQSKATPWVIQRCTKSPEGAKAILS